MPQVYSSTPYLVRTIIEYQYKITLLANVTKTVAVIDVWLCCKGT